MAYSGRPCFHDAGDLPELAADLHHDGLGSRLHGAHGHGGEDEHQQGADEQANQSYRVEQVNGSEVNGMRISREQSQCSKCSRTDSKAFADSSSSVAN